MISSKLLFPEVKDNSHFIDFLVSSIESDSRSVKEGSVYFALDGTNENGSIYIDEAIRRGAKLIFAENIEEKEGIIQVAQLREYLGVVASRFYDNPTLNLYTFCVTGTNGKTSCVESLSKLLNFYGEKCSYISTIGVSYDGTNLIKKSDLTTPDPITLQSLFSSSLKAGSTHVAFEASSHGLSQKRISGTKIGTAIFTSFSQDHLDYHQNLESYKSAKLSLFRDYSPSTSIIQVDTDTGREIYTELKILGKSVFSVSSKETADFFFSYKRKNLYLEITLKSTFGSSTFNLSTVSSVLASNIVCALAALLVKGFDLGRLIKNIQNLTLPEGRMELIQLANGNFCCIDYAHTPEALEKTLLELKSSVAGEIWCIFGCGGDRDKIKRPLMGEIAERLCKKVVLSNDNPRSEEEKDIFDEILKGTHNPSKIKVVNDRELAILECLSEISKSDIPITLLVAGKGHEDYQETGITIKKSSDKEIVNNFVREQK